MFDFLFGLAFVQIVGKFSKYRPGDDMAMFLAEGETNKATVKFIEYFALLMLQFLVADLLLANFRVLVEYYGFMGN